MEVKDYTVKLAKGWVRTSPDNDWSNRWLFVQGSGESLTVLKHPNGESVAIYVKNHERTPGLIDIASAHSYWPEATLDNPNLITGKCKTKKELAEFLMEHDGVRFSCEKFTETILFCSETAGSPFKLSHENLTVGMFFMWDNFLNVKLTEVKE